MPANLQHLKAADAVIEGKQGEQIEEAVTEATAAEAEQDAVDARN